MADWGRQLDIRLASDQLAMKELLTSVGVSLSPEAIEFITSRLSEQWLTLWGSQFFNIKTGAKGTIAFHLREWVELVRAIYDMRSLRGMDEQLRRLDIQSHESLDTSLVIRVAGRYVRQGFLVDFEPNGEGCSDLLIAKDAFRSYVEVKRENEQEHRRLAAIQTVSREVVDSLEKLTAWLEERELRLEIKFSRLFSTQTIEAITREIQRKVHSVAVGVEHSLPQVADSRYIVLPRQSNVFFERGVHSGTIRVKEAGKPVQLVPENMPVRVTFDWLPNIAALKRRLQKAGQQLKNDTAKDPNARGFFVIGASHGEEAKDKIVEYFSQLPSNCLGVVLISIPSYVVPRSDAPSDMIQIMAIAGTVES